MNDEKFNHAASSTPRWGGKLKQFYNPADISLDYTRHLGDPGQYPFTRGLYPGMYRTKMWTMRELSGYGSPEDTRERVGKLSDMGTTGVSVIVDVTTSLGIDPDHPLAEGQVGLRGVPLTSLKDMESLLEGIPLDKLSVNIIHSTCTAFISFAQYIAVAEKRGIDIAKVRGMVQNHPITSLYGTPHPDKPVDICLKEAGDILEHSIKFMPLWNPININPNCIHTHGVNVPFEIAVVMATAIAHIREGLERGLGIDEIASRITVALGTHVNLFEEVAMCRAYRRLWAWLMKEEFGAQSLRAQMLRLGVHTRGDTLYAQEPLNNIVRLTLEALAAVMGGVQSLEVAGYDETLCLPTEESHLMSLRIQQIVAYESGIANVADPLGGSYYIEYLTHKFEEEARDILRTIEEMGGIVEVIRNGWLDGQLDKASLKYYGSIQSGEQIVVGVNAFRQPGETPQELEVIQVSPDSQRLYLDRLADLKATRNIALVKERLAELKRVVEKKDGENWIPYVVEAVKAYATTGEIFGIVREALGYPYDPLCMIDSPFKE